MNKKTEGIVLRAVKATGSRSVLTIYSRDEGLLSLAAILSKKKMTNVLSEALTIVEVTYSGKESAEIKILREARVVHPYSGLALNFNKRMIGTFLNEVLFACIKEMETNTGMYDFIKNSLIQLDTAEVYGSFHLKFLAEFTDYLGCHPSYNGEPWFDLIGGEGVTHEPSHGMVLKGETLKYFWSLFSPINTVPSIPSVYKEDVLDGLMAYYKTHVDNFKSPRSLEIIKDVYLNLRQN